MASLRNAIPQRTYRERAQPKSREKLGLLEKHKDYSSRARDYNEKKKRLKILREKATNRNPDEFHFGMMSSRTRGGVKIADRGTKALSQEVVKLMKTQDAGYLRTVRERVRKQKERLEEALQVANGEEGMEIEVLGGRRSEESQRHMVFVDDEEEQKVLDLDWRRTSRGEKPDADDEKLFNEEVDQPQRQRSRKQLDAELRKKREEQKRRKKLKEDQQHRKAKLEALRAQEQELLIAEQELERQRAKMHNTVGGVNKNGVKFKVRERKR